MRRLFLFILAAIIFTVPAFAETIAVNWDGGCFAVDNDGRISMDNSGFQTLYAINDISGNLIGFAADAGNGRFAYISRNGRRLSSPVFLEIRSAGKMLIGKMSDGWHLMTLNGDILPTAYSDIVYTGSGMYLALTSDIFDDISDSLRVVYDKDVSFSTGVLVQHGLTDFSERRMSVLDGSTRKYGYLDPSGQWAIEPAYEYASDFANARAIVVKDGLYGAIDLNGEYVIKPRYAYLTVSEGYFCGVVDEHVYMIDPNGNILFKTDLDGASASLSAGKLILSSPESTTVLNANGRLIFSLEGAVSVSSAGDDYMICDMDGTYLANRIGRRISDRFDTLTLLDDSYSNTLFVFTRSTSDGAMKKGIIDASGKILRDGNYTYIIKAFDGVYAAVRDGKPEIIHGDEFGLW